MAINEVTSIDVKTLPPFKRLIMTIGELPTSYLESMTYAELLMWFCNFLQEKVLPTINNNADALQEVITYLENLDLQDEVNNKLDEMVEAGTLQEIIASYLNANALWCFDNVDGMKSAPNLIAGSFARTLGYYSVNDGGNGLYKIRQVTNEDTEDDMLIIALDDENLVAELVSDKTNLLTCGGKKDDNTFDNGAIINKMISAGLLNINMPTGTYYCATTITLVDNLQINGNNSSIYYTGSTNFIEHTTTDELAYVKIKSLKIYGNTSSTGIRVRGFIESSIENVLLQNFNIGLYTYYSWDSYFKKVRIQSCNKPFDLASQSNNLLFDNCAFATFNTRIECNNAEGIIFNACDFTGCTANVCIYGYQSNLNFIGCYYEELSGKFLAIPDNGACYINIYGGKCTDDHLIINGGTSFINFTNLQGGQIRIVGRNTATDNPAVSAKLQNLNMPENFYKNRYECPHYFDGTFSKTLSVTAGVSQSFTDGEIVLTSTSSGINYMGLPNLVAGNQYLLILEGKLETTSKNITCQFLENSVPDTSGLYAVNISLNDYKIVCPFRAMHTNLRLGWTGTEAFHISKLIIMPMD